MPKLTDAERRKLIDKLNEETQNFIEEKRKKNANFKYEDGFSDENIDEILATHPAFLKTQPTQEEIDNNPLLQGLQQIQYDPDDSPYDIAMAYKKDGNFQFKLKNYKLACANYTEAIKSKCTDIELLTVLYSNRAAANFHLENYRSSLLDATQAVKMAPERIKSLLRCAQCCQKLKRFDDAISWSQIILSLEPENKSAADMQDICAKEKTVQERNERKKALNEHREAKKKQQLEDAIRSRKINIKLSQQEKLSDSENNDGFEASLSKGLKKVYLDDNNILVWPVLLLYPEFETTDFIEMFHENVAFQNVLENVFADFAEWDVKKRYKVSELVLFFENADTQTLYEVPVHKTLGEIISLPSFIVQASTPNFFVLSKLSSFLTSFKKKWKAIYMV